jgi:HEAT repeat protein
MVRQAAARDLGRRQTDVALETLLDRVKKGIANPRVLAATIEALGRYASSPDAHIVVLRHAESAPGLYVQAAAIQALGRLRANQELVSKSLKILQTIATGPARRYVRASAIESLASLGEDRAQKTLLALAQPGRNEPLRPEAIRALGTLGKQKGLRDQTYSVLKDWLDDPDRIDQEAAITSVGQLGDPRALQDLERIQISSRAPGLREAAKTAQAMIRRNSDSDSRVSDLERRLAGLEKQNKALQERLKLMEMKKR